MIKGGRKMSSRVNGTGPGTFRLMASALLFSSLVVMVAGPVRSEPAPSDDKVHDAGSDEATAAPNTQPAPADVEAVLKPRFELYMTSVGRLAAEARRAHSGVFLGPLAETVRAMARASAEGVDTDALDAIVEQIGRWPDTAAAVYAYAPDTEGRSRWAVRVEWPVGDLCQRVESLLEADATKDLFEGVTLQAGDAGWRELTLGGSPLAYVGPLGDTHACLSSHADLPVPVGRLTDTLVLDNEGPPLVAGRLNLTGTERDSGATFLSSFSAFTDIVYTGHVGEQGDWVEAVHVHWPPISGVGAKALFGRVKQTFFVPDEAFGALVFKAIMAPGMLDGLAGFGQQMVLDASGQMAIVGEAGPGPIMSGIEPELCVTLLPGTGFLPMPDIVVQARTNRAKRLIHELCDAAQSLNQAFLEREQREPWHEGTVAERTVLWSDGTNQYPGMMMPLVLRPVLFTTTEVDARDRQRDFLVLAWTSTSPKGFVQRWLNLPRSMDRRYLPEQRKTNGQAWVNWKQVYKWVSPYLNTPLGALIGQVPLPALDDVRADMTDALVTIKLSYSGLEASHQGPLPAGLLILPALVSASVAADTGGGSDLARERLACQRLKVLYHHAKLFKKDIGRWPAEVAELDGYVDFAGHPELLKLKLSARRQWGAWFDGLFGADGDEEKKEDGADVDVFGAIDDKLYEIDWGRETWRLKLAPKTLEHLEELYIDQDGEIHRKEKTGPTDREELTESGKRGDGWATGPVLQRAAQNIEHRYLATREPSETKKECTR
jgi:hypothetical protein